MPSKDVEAFLTGLASGDDAYLRHLAQQWKQIPIQELKSLRQREWATVASACAALRPFGERIGQELLLTGDIWRFPDESFSAKQIDVLHAFAQERMQDRGRPGLKSSLVERTFWMAALLPYLLFRTGKPHWRELAVVIGKQTGYDALGGQALQIWWKQSVVSMGKRIAKMRVKRGGTITLPDNAPFDIALEFLRFEATLGAAGARRYKAIVFKEMPFLRFCSLT